MTPSDLARLLSLAEVRRSRDLARLDAALVEDRRLAAEIADLAKTAERDLIEGDLPPAQQAARAAWVDQRIVQVRTRRDALARLLPALRATAAQSLGKHRALEHVLERAEAEAARARGARAERESPPPAAQP